MVIHSHKGDFESTLLIIFKLGCVGFVAGFLNGGFGIGTGFTLNVFLVAFNSPPAVAAATAMFCGMISCISSTVTIFLFN